MLRIMLVDSNFERTEPLNKALTAAGYEVVAHLSDTADLNKEVERHNPDVIVIDVDSPSRDTLEHISFTSRSSEKPVLMFTQDEDAAKIRSATRAGVSAYVVGTVADDRLKPIISAAIARFEEFRDLKLQLDLANNKLADRKLIERAKGLLMKRRGLAEDEAYALMRSQAMEQNIKLSELAKRLIQAAELI